MSRIKCDKKEKRKIKEKSIPLLSKIGFKICNSKKQKKINNGINAVIECVIVRCPKFLSKYFAIGKNNFPIILLVWSISGSNEEKIQTDKYKELEKILISQKLKEIPVIAIPPTI
jgi:hypothetical protein